MKIQCRYRHSYFFRRLCHEPNETRPSAGATKLIMEKTDFAVVFCCFLPLAFFVVLDLLAGCNQLCIWALNQIKPLHRVEYLLLIYIVVHLPMILSQPPESKRWSHAFISHACVVVDVAFVPRFEFGCLGVFSLDPPLAAAVLLRVELRVGRVASVASSSASFRCRTKMNINWG